MPTGPDHYGEAERLLALVASGGAEFVGAAQLTAEAQVHATLALAAVHAYGLPSGEWQETVSRDKGVRLPEPEPEPERTTREPS